MTLSSFMVVAVLAVSISIPLQAQMATSAPKSPKPVAAATSTDIINLNIATAAQIATLPGIGPKTADLIVQYRQKNNGFKKIEEIMNVRGIGEKTFLKLKNRLSVTPTKSDDTK